MVQDHRLRHQTARAATEIKRRMGQDAKFTGQEREALQIILVTKIGNSVHQEQ
jgi:phage baseplate assembly protein W